MQVYDTTLRDGAQREGITYSVVDKLAVARLLDEFGVGFIEGGWPGAMPKDTEFFRRARSELNLRHALFTAFGATRKAGAVVERDPQVRALLDAETPVVTLVAKSDVRHVERALRTTREENLAMVRDTVSYLVREGRRVFLDCEHFFDGYLFDPAYTLSVAAAALEAGAEAAVMCDTNGGMVPSRITWVVGEVRSGLAKALGISEDEAVARLGIHCQNDTSCAVANTLAAVEAGVPHFQCTANGYGERPGNADLFAVVGNLQLKLGLTVLPEGCLEQMVRVSHAIAEIANVAPDTHQAYVGSSAFAHKAGLHASAIKVDPVLYNHVDPVLVGNDMRILVTEMAGRASIELKSRELGLDLAGNPDALSRVTERVKDLEVRGERIIATAEGNGPINALDEALRVALAKHYPALARFELGDYKVRILEGSHGSGAITRVLVETFDGVRDWTTVGVHENVVEASWHALVDALSFGLAHVTQPASAA